MTGKGRVDGNLVTSLEREGRIVGMYAVYVLSQYLDFPGVLRIMRNLELCLARAGRCYAKEG